MTARDEHIADRPTWNCRVCTMPWPCRTARAELPVEFREFPSMLIIHLYGLMAEAADDLQTMDGLPARFLGWVSPAFTVTST